MGLVKNLLSAGRDYLESKEEEKSYTLLSPADTHAAVKSAMEFQRGYGGWNTYGLGYSGQSFNESINRNDVRLSNELGDVRFLSLIIGAVRWASRNFTDARFNVVKVGQDRKESEIQDHELTSLFKRPNPYYSGLTFWCGMMLSNICRGEMHALKVRDKKYNARLLELYYEPFWTIRPVWNQDGSDFISYYEILRNGVWKRWGKDADDVFVVYDVGIDPETRRGMLNATASLVHEFFSDKQMVRFLGNLFQNGLVPPVVVSVGSKDTPGPTGDDWKAMKADGERHFTSSGSGKPWFVNGPVEPHRLGYDYSSMGFDEVRKGIEARVASAMGISVISLMLSAGLEHSAYNNVKEYHTHDYRSYIVPLHKLVSAEIDHQMLPEFGETKGIESRWDYSEVAVMQRDRIDVAKETEILVRSRVIDQYEARERHSYKSDESMKNVFYPVPSNTITISPIDEAIPSEPILEPVVKPNGAAKPS